MRQLLTLLSFLLLTIAIAFSVTPLRAEELDDVTADLARQQQQLSDLEKRKAQLSRDISSASLSLSQVSIQLTAAEDELAAIENDLVAKETELAWQEDVRDLLIRQLYIQSRISSFEVILSSEDLGESARQFQYYNENINSLGGTITQLAEQVTIFQSNKATAQSIRDDLAALRTQYQSTVSYSQRQLSSTSNQISEVQFSIKTLTGRQQELILAKIGNSLATGSLVLADDPNARVTFDPGFSPAFAGFSFGAYTHRNGMSQYGALGRANSRQPAEQILSAYYPSEVLNKNYPIPSVIYVNGTNEYGQTFNCEEFAFNDYIKHLYEVPSSWPTEVLRAQAVAARSYAIKYIRNTSNRCNGQPYICPSQGCQVIKKEINASSWQTAVNDTATWVLSGGSGNFQYSSTSGGYLNTSGWDTTSHSQNSWPDGAFENIGGSPWFYKGWWKFLSDGKAQVVCGRSHPWLTETEFADILNSWVVYTKGDSNDKARVTTIDTACWGGNPYSISEMRDRADSLGGSYSKVYGVAASYSSSGYTSLISLATDRGAITIDGPTFRDIFNLRAPGHLALKTPLYNIEKK